MMLEFLRQLSHEACHLFEHISTEVNGFANSKHTRPNFKKTDFTRAKGSIAFDIGLLHASIQSFASGRDNWAESVCHLQTSHLHANSSKHFVPESLYGLMPEVSEQLQWLGRGFSPARFEEGTKSLRIEHAGIHIANSTPGGSR